MADVTVGTQTVLADDAVLSTIDKEPQVVSCVETAQVSIVEPPEVAHEEATVSTLQAENTSESITIPQSGDDAQKSNSIDETNVRASSSDEEKSEVGEDLDQDADEEACQREAGAEANECVISELKEKKRVYEAETGQENDESPTKRTCKTSDEC